MKKLNKGGVIACIVSAFVLLSQIFGMSFDSAIVDKIVAMVTGILVIFGIISNNNLGGGTSAEKIIDILKDFLKMENTKKTEKAEVGKDGEKDIEKKTETEGEKETIMDKKN